LSEQGVVASNAKMNSEDKTGKHTNRRTRRAAQAGGGVAGDGWQQPAKHGAYGECGEAQRLPTL
jgi:hypothetical protein